MKTLLIDGFSNVTKEGLTLHFNERFSPHNDVGFKTDEWWVSWDKIGEAICGGQYCEETDATELNKIRKANQLESQVDVKIAEEDSGLEEFDKLVKQYNNKEIDIDTLVNRMWNYGYACGGEDAQRARSNFSD